MLRVQRLQWQGYVISTLSVLLALLLGLLLEQRLKIDVSPLFFAAVVFSSCYGGFASGLIATILAILVHDYFFLPPFYSLAINSESDLLQLIVFSLVALLISSLNAQLQSAKQRFEANLAKLQVSYRSLLETAHEGIWLFNNRGQTEYLNQRLAQMVGYRFQEMVNCSIFDFMERQSQIEVERWLEQQRQKFQDIKQQFDLRLRSKDGSTVWVIVSISPLLNKQGEFSGALAMLTDITERKQQEEALQQSEQRFRRLIESNIFGVAFADFSGNIHYANDAFLKMVGYEREDLLAGRLHWDAMTPLEFLHLDAQAQVELRKRGSCTPFEKEYIRKDGNRVPILFGATLLQEPYAEQQEIAAFFFDLTKRKEAEKTLAQEQAKRELERQHLRTILEILPIGVLISDAQGQLIEMNPAVKTIWGEDAPLAKEVSQYREYKGWWASTGEPIAAEDWALARALAKSEAVIGEEVDIETFEGQRKTILNSAVPIRDYTDAIVNWVVVNVDITARKQMEAALCQKQEWLDMAQKAAKIGSFEWNIQTNIHIWSKELEAIYGLQPGEFGGSYEEWIKWVHPDDLAQAEANIRNSLETGEMFADWRVIWQDGSVHWLHARASVFYDDNGQPLKMVGINGDISDRKQVEIALQNSEARFRRIVDSNVIGFFFGDMSGKITYANDTFLQMLGYTQEDVQTGKIDWYNLTPKKYIKPTQQAVEELRKYGVCAPFEKEFFCKDGSRVFVVIAAALFDDSSEHGFSYVLNITARRQAEEERDRLLQLEQAARAEAEAANRLKDEFLAIVSHELRSPLNPILGWSKLLLTRKLDAARTTHALEIIERNAKLQTRLIDDLLDVSRILRGKLGLNICAVDLVATIESAMETVRLAAEAKSIQIQTQLAPAVSIKGDPNRLQQVVWNLLSNAVKFTPQGGLVEIRLEVEQGNRGDKEELSFTSVPDSSPSFRNYAQITVTDTGKGIRPDFLPYVFERFRQADEATTRMFGGLGLGLAIVRHIVELHGGSVQVTSPGEGLGATFTVTLPLLADVSQTTENFSLPDSSPNLQGLRILVVDDDVDTLNLLAFILEQYGATVRAVSSATEALVVLKNSQPDLLLSDIAMPAMDGYMLIKQIRASEVASRRRLPAIALTAFAGETDHNQILAAGFQTHLTKPIEPSKLAVAIAQLTKENKMNIPQN